MRNVGIALSVSLIIAGACASPASRDEAPPVAENAAQEGSAAAAPAASPDQALDAEWQKLSVQEQKKHLLVEQHLVNASSYESKVMLKEAESEALAALDVDPQSLAAKQKLAEIRSLMGKPADQAVTVQQELARQHELKVQQLRLDTEDSLSKAKSMLARGDWDLAISELTLASDRIRWAPYSLDWGGLDKQVNGLLEESKRNREQALKAQHAESQQKAYEQLKLAEKAEAQRLHTQVSTILAQAIDAFEAGKYDEAMRAADEALKRDPRNEKALEVRDSAFRAGRKKVADTYLREKNERFQTWREEMDELRVPYTDVVTPPDEEHWAAITAARAARTGWEASSRVNASDDELLAKLRETRVPFKITAEGNLNTVVATLKTITGLPLIVHPAAATAAADAGVTFEFNLSSPMSVDRILNLICQAAGENVTWAIQHDAVMITTKDKALGDMVLKNHPVQDLIMAVTDFVGPRIDRLRLLDENTDEDGSGAFATIGEPHVIIESEELANLIKDNVAVGTWEQPGVSLTAEMGNLLVRHRPEVQNAVRQFLEDLRRFSASMVTIESKFMSVEENWLQEVGVDFRGLDDPATALDDVTNGLEDQASNGLDNNGTGVNGSNAAGPPSAGFFYDDGQDGTFTGHTENIFDTGLGKALSNIGGITAQWTFLNDLQVSAILRAVEKSSNVELVNDQVVSVHNTQRAYVTVINQRAYIQDFDVEVATFQAVADPMINVLSEGIVLDVRPTIHHDRRYLTLEIQPTVARIVSMDSFSTALGGATSPVTMQLPELEVKSVFTTAVVPDGGSILLGGLSRVRNIERRAEVPWLANVPLVGFFFKNEGYNDEKSGLMILLRAWITDVKETLAQSNK